MEKRLNGVWSHTLFAVGISAWDPKEKTKKAACWLTKETPFKTVPQKKKDQTEGEKPPGGGEKKNPHFNIRKKKKTAEPTKRFQKITGLNEEGGRGDGCHDNCDSGIENKKKTIIDKEGK